MHWGQGFPETTHALPTTGHLLPWVSPGQQAEDDPEGSRASEAPGDSPKRVARRSSISYDQAEEELMASIEREYGC
ncbi:cystin-1 [Fukomys damarensis]|uniref:Cystin-1 n=1 Tax=Fukomys damarensis TaxID=885580 RepID=A0A091DLA1_FUKDA|nr:cystin-1 [Fukomys damarensis]KFO31208.1 Cystin-1 [Fukomys damarensis]